MSTSATPFGLRALRTVGGYMSGAIQQIKIASGYTSAIANGDIVKMVAAGTIEKDTGTDAATPIGVFIGCAYTDAGLGFVNRTYWPANTVSADAMGYVVTDPNALFLIQADAAVPQTALGINFALVQTAPNTTFGQSRVALDASSLTTTNTFPVRLVDFWVDGENAINDTYTMCVVKLQVGHQMDAIAGV